jgi:hypothetical protein
MGAFVDLAGQRFGKLIVQYDVRRKVGQETRVFWICNCDCGGQIEVRNAALRSGNNRSCGCLPTGKVVHGHARRKEPTDPTYQTWESMNQRCNNPNHKKYKWYGGRGITIDPSWKSFKQFLADMGPRPPGKTLDRIDNDLGYSKGNCRWATSQEQITNRSI